MGDAQKDGAAASGVAPSAVASDSDSDSDDYFSNPLKRFSRKRINNECAVCPSATEPPVKKSSARKKDVEDSNDGFDFNWDDDEDENASEAKDADLSLLDLDVFPLQTRRRCGAAASQRNGYAAAKATARRDSSSTAVVDQTRSWHKKTNKGASCASGFAHPCACLNGTSKILAPPSFGSTSSLSWRSDEEQQTELLSESPPVKSTPMKHCSIEVNDMELLQTKNLFWSVERSLTELADRFAKEWNCEVEYVELVFSDNLRQIDVRKTPSELGFSVDEPNRVSAMKASLPLEKRPDYVKLKWLLPERRPIVSFVPKKTCFRTLKEDFARENDLLGCQLVLVFDSERIQDNETPEGLGMEKGDCIDVLGTQTSAKK